MHGELCTAVNVQSEKKHSRELDGSGALPSVPVWFGCAAMPTVVEAKMREVI